MENQIDSSIQSLFHLLKREIHDHPNPIAERTTHFESNPIEARSSDLLTQETGLETSDETMDSLSDQNVPLMVPQPTKAQSPRDAKSSKRNCCMRFMNIAEKPFALVRFVSDWFSVCQP
jgi:hypothetical protein